MSSFEAKSQQWKQKLVGKTYSDTTTESTDANIITKKDLPQAHRILKKDSFTTFDFVEERVNVKIDDNNKIIDVTLG